MSPDLLPWSWSKILLASQIAPNTGRAPRRPETTVGMHVHRLARLLSQEWGQLALTFPDNLAIEACYFTNLGRLFAEELPRLKALVGQPAEVWSELQIRLDDSLEPVYGWPHGYIVGVLDLLLLNRCEGRAVIVDLKKGSSLSSEQIDDHRRQLQLYSLLVHQGLALHRVFDGELTWLTDGLQAHDQETEAALTNMHEIKQTRNSMCGFCEFRDSCLAYQVVQKHES